MIRFIILFHTMAGFRLSEAAKRLSQPDALSDLLGQTTQAQQRGDTEAIFFGGGLPSNKNYTPPEGVVARNMAQISGEISSDPDRSVSSFQYGEARGYEPLRQIMVDEHQERWGVKINPNQVQIIIGSQGGIFYSILLTSNDGDAVLVDNPTYPGNTAAAKILPVEIWGIHSDSEGPVPEDVRDAVRIAKNEGRRVSLLLVAGKGNPDTSRRLTKQRLEDLAEIAERNRFALADDRAYDLLSNDKEEIPPATVIIPDNGIYLRTFSKPGAPGFRVGWMVGPEDLIDSASQVAFGIHLAPPGLTQVMAAEYILSGKMEKNLTLIRKQYAQSRQTMMEALDAEAGDEIEYKMPHEGTMFFDAKNTLGVDTLKAAPVIAAKQKVFVLPQAACTAKRVIGETEEDRDWKTGGMRLNHTNPPLERIPEGVRRLKDGLKQAARDRHTSYPKVSQKQPSVLL